MRLTQERRRAVSRAKTIEKLRERYPRLDIEEREYEDERGRNVGIVASCDEFPATATWRTYKVWATGPPTPEHVAEAEAKLEKLRTALTPVGEECVIGPLSPAQEEYVREQTKDFEKRAMHGALTPVEEDLEEDEGDG